MWRKIKTKRLIKSGLAYRVIVICVNALFFKLGVRSALEHFGAIGASLIWNGINMCLYWAYHYIFARAFRLGDARKS